MRVDEHLIQQLAERLKQAVHDTRHIETAQIQIVGLEDVRRRAGNLWPELAARVRETSRDFIGQRVGPHDLVFPAGDGFLVVYAEAEGAPAKSQILQDELNAFYLGGENTQFLSVSVTHEQLIPTAVIERLSARSAPAGQSAAPPTAAAPGAVSLSVLPVWSVQQEAVTGYWITPVHPERRYARYGYDSAWSETGWHEDDKDFLELDLRILRRAVDEAETSLKRGRRCLVGYSAHSTTLMNKGRRQTFLQALAETPAEVRPLLLGRVAEVQAGTPMATIADWVHQQRPVVPRMAIEVHHGQRDLTGLEDVGIFSVSCVLPVANPTAAEVATLSRTITTWGRDLRRQNLKLRLDNLNDPRLLALVTDAHVDFCTSPRLWPAAPAAEGMKPYSRDQFLKALALPPAERVPA